jgi:hypothetical protein
VNSQQLLFLGLLFGSALVLYFIFSRNKRRMPVRLRMKDEPVVENSEDLALMQPKSKAEILAAIEPIFSAENTPEVGAMPVAQESESSMSETVPIKVVPVVPIKTTKVFFAFNGHDWEAYEALGVPVNAPLTTVTKMYQHLIKTSDSSTFDFFESAYNAIIKKRKENLS